MRSRTVSHRRRLLSGIISGVAAAWCLASASARAADPEPVETGLKPEAAPYTAGPLIHTFPLTLEPGFRTEAAGPLYYEEDNDTDTIWALPPFVSELRSHDGDRSVIRVLPPLFTYRRYGRDMRWEVGQWLNGSRVDTIADKELKRFSIFPIFFYQDAPDPNRRYWGLIPVYGKLRNRLGLDEVRFAAFPLWIETKRGAATTENYLFPIGQVRSGPGLEGWKIWPIVGHERLEPSSRTNSMDELEVVPGYEKSFVVWPIRFREHSGLGTRNPVEVDAVLPLYHRLRSPERDQTSVLWPFVSWSEDRAEKYHQWSAPWPMVSFAHGEGRTLHRVLPFFNVGHTPTLDIESYGWPIYRRQHLHTPNMDRDRRQYGFYLFVDLRETNPESKQHSRRLDSWPFFSYSKDREGNERFQTLALAEVFGNSPGIQANWSPVWALWRQEHNAKTGAQSQSLLWNLYRRESSGGVTRGSLLFGLVQYEKNPDGRRWRWFHLGPPLCGKPAATPGKAAIPSESHVPKSR